MKRAPTANRPSRFDAFKLAVGGESIAGVVDAARFPRVADRLAHDGGPAAIAWKIVGGYDAQARPALTLSLKGSIPLLCQRCLKAFAASVDQQTELLLARDEAELARLDADLPEVVLANAPLDAENLVEDELLLSLPFAPRHDEGECASRATPEPGHGVASAFASLAALKKGMRSR